MLLPGMGMRAYLFRRGKKEERKKKREKRRGKEEEGKTKREKRRGRSPPSAFSN
jgi:hypothetical protein